MVVNELFQRFSHKATATVMIRGVLENIVSARRLNAVFDDAAEVQYTRDLLFSQVVRLMSQVVLRIQPSVHAAYLDQAKELNVAAKTVYDKLEGVEPRVCQAMLRSTAREMALVIQTLDGQFPQLVPGYRTKILDGNHLAGTDRRLRCLRGRSGAALPGQSLVVLDPALKLATDVFPCEDAHQQERALLADVLPTVEANDLWVADRNFCTRRWLFGVHERKAFFLIRQHQLLPCRLLGEPVYVGRIETGEVFEQQAEITDAAGQPLLVRRITIKLDEPTRDGETEIHLLSNLPPDVDALRLASLYRQRWQIETAFQEMTVDLSCEISTLGYPKAALLAFCIALICYNAISVVKAALRVADAPELPDEPPVSAAPREPHEAPALEAASAACVNCDVASAPDEPPVSAAPHGSHEAPALEAASAAGVNRDVASAPDEPPVPVAPRETPAPRLRAVPHVRRQDEISTYYLADEVASTWRGMSIALPDSFWEEKFASLTSEELAAELRQLARKAKPGKYRKRPASAKRTSRKPPSKPGSHVSTARALTGQAKSEC